MRHDPEADAAYVYLTNNPAPRAAETCELEPDSVFVDYAADGTLIGVEFLWVGEGVRLDRVPRADEVGQALQAAGIAIKQAVP